LEHNSISSSSCQPFYSLCSVGAAAAEDKVCCYSYPTARHYHNNHGDSKHLHSFPYSLSKLRGQPFRILASAAAAVNPTNLFILLGQQQRGTRYVATLLQPPVIIIMIMVIRLHTHSYSFSLANLRGQPFRILASAAAAANLTTLFILGGKQQWKTRYVDTLIQPPVIIITIMAI